MTTKMEPPSTFGPWLQHELARRDWKGADLARRLGVANGDVSRWLRGVTRPSPASVRKIADELFVDPDVALAVAGHRDRDIDVDPDSPGEQIAAMARRVEWTPDRYETARSMLAGWLERDRRRRAEG